MVIELVRATLLAAHLLAGALACGAPAAAACVQLFGRRDEDPDTAGRLVGAGLLAMLASLMFGGLSGVLLAIMGDGRYLATFGRLPSRDLLLLVTEWFFTLVLYGVTLPLIYSQRRRWAVAVALIAVTNLAYHFPTIMIVLGTEASEPSLTPQTLLDRAAFRERITLPVNLAKTLHFWGLCVLTGAVATACVSGIRWITPRVAWVILGGVVLQMGSGVWTLIASPVLKLRELTGADPFAAAAFFAGVATTLLLCHAIGPAVLGERDASPTRRVAWLVLTIVLLMAYASVRVRGAAI